MKNIIQIINEEIEEGIGDSDYYDLASAQRHYGNLVPWQLDNVDLELIKRQRDNYFTSRPNRWNKDQKAVSDAWDKHMQDTAAALWKYAEMKKNKV